MSDLDIMSVNADGSVSSTTGYVEDGKAAVAPVVPAKPAEAEEPADEPLEEEPVTEPGESDDSGIIAVDPSQPPAETSEPIPDPSPAPSPDPEPPEPAEAPAEPAEPQPEETPDFGFSIIEPPPAV